MGRPLIGITIDTSDKPDHYESPIPYAAAIERAGGLPVLLPYHAGLSLVPEYVDRCAGFLFTGGNDLDPALYAGGDYHEKAEPIDTARQKFELALIAEVERRRRPAMGICLGSQLMNVHRGGSLYQFLPELDRDGPLEHRKLNDWKRRHDVTVTQPDAALAQAFGSGQFSANTSHKQAVKRLGRGLRVVAVASDGVVEAFDDPGAPALFAAVQWHPERLTDEPAHLGFFKLLVNASS